jgi:DNA-directed RNA polymerase specialized sigma24 family protein
MNAEHAAEEALLLSRAAGGDMNAWGALLIMQQERLKNVATFRLDPRLRGRIDAADVMQEAFMAAPARRHIPGHTSRPSATMKSEKND